MNILSIETATDACSAALWVDGNVIEQFKLAPREHTQRLFPMIEQLLAEASLKMNQIDYLAFGRGPGAFTGVRIATGVIQGLAFAVDRPVVPVSTLAALAYGAWRTASQLKVLSAMDARMNEVYWGGYQFSDTGEIANLIPEQVVAPDAVQLPQSDGWFGCGSGWGVYEISTDKVHGVAASALPHAQDVAHIAAQMIKVGEVVTAAEALPVYLRDNVAKKAGEQKR